MAKELLQNLDLPSGQPEICQILSSPKRVGFHIKEYKQLHQCSTYLLLSHKIYAKLQELRNMRFQQYHSAFHLQKLLIVSPDRFIFCKKKNRENRQMQ